MILICSKKACIAIYSSFSGLWYQLYTIHYTLQYLYASIDWPGQQSLKMTRRHWSSNKRRLKKIPLKCLTELFCLKEGERSLFLPSIVSVVALWLSSVPPCIFLSVTSLIAHCPKSIALQVDTLHPVCTPSGGELKMHSTVQCTMHSALARGVADQLARGPTSNVPSSLDVLLITLITLITHCHGWCVNISTHHLMNHSSLSLLSLFDLNTEFSQFLQDQHFECTARLISSIYSLCLLCKIMFNMFKW